MSFFVGVHGFEPRTAFRIDLAGNSLYFSKGV